jgi:hypothetical protein
MNTFIFVAVMCMGAKCDFVITHQTVTETKCQEIKQQFFSLPFKPEVTVVAADCMMFNDNKVKL